MQQERRGHGVEQLGVVDAQHDLAATGLGAQRVGAATHELERVVGAHVVGDEPGEGAERHRRGAAGGLRPDGEGAGALRGGVRLAREARLAHARPGAHDDAAAASSPIASAIRVSSASRPTSGHVAEMEDVAAGDPPCMARLNSNGAPYGVRR